MALSKQLILLFLVFVFLPACTCKNEKLHRNFISKHQREIDSLVLEKVLYEKDIYSFHYNQYNQSSANFVSKLYEIPGRDSNAYRLTISRKDGKKAFQKY